MLKLCNLTRQGGKSGNFNDKNIINQHMKNILQLS